jgi:hypothetical protein
MWLGFSTSDMAICHQPRTSTGRGQRSITKIHSCSCGKALDHRHTAIDGECLANHVACSGTAQPQDRRNDLLGLPGPANRHILRNVRIGIFDPTDDIACDLRVDQPWIRYLPGYLRRNMRTTYVRGVRVSLLARTLARALAKRSITIVPRELIRVVRPRCARN